MVTGAGRRPVKANYNCQGRGVEMAEAKGVPQEIEEQLQQAKEKEYQELVKQSEPGPNIATSVLAAFVTGGTITTIGQGIMKGFLRMGIPPDGAAGPTAAVLVLAAAVLTGIGVYDRIGRFGGMGAALPITGFANSIVSPAMEFKREGYVLGTGAKMFAIAGPVVVFALVTGTLVAAIQLILGQ